nr:hypothetical protein GCM10020241_08190 [Streptoalloteichus tenebrarius]
MHQHRRLPGHHLHQLRVVVPEGQHTGSGEEVDEHVAVDVPHEAARALGDGDRQVARVGAGAGLPPVLAGQELRRARPGEVGPDVGTGQGVGRVDGHRTLLEDVVATGVFSSTNR